MSLTIIIGKKNKSAYMYELVKACEGQKKHALIFVPKSYKATAEKEYINYTNKQGMIDSIITDISTYISKTLDLYNIDFKGKLYLPELAKKMCIKKCIKENEEIFKIFRNVKDTNGFVEIIYSYLSKAETERSLESFLNKEENICLFESDNILNEKINEIFKIYTKYKEEIKEKFITSVETIDVFISALQNKKLDDAFEDTVVFFDNYNNFSALECLVIENLLKKDIDVTITIDLDLCKATNMTTNIYDISYDTYNKLIQIAKDSTILVNVINLDESYIKNNIKANKELNSNLEILKDNIFSVDYEVKNNKSNLNTIKNDNSVKLTVCNNPYKEIEYIAKNIKIKVKEDNVRFKDFAIYTNNMAEYKDIIDRVFKKYGIPAYIDSKIDIVNSNIYRYIKSILALSLNPLYKNTDNIFIFLKSGLLNIDIEDIFLLENYIKEFGIFAYDFNKEFIKNNKSNTNYFVYDLNMLNNIRQKIIDILTEFKNSVLNNNKLTDDLNTQDIVKNIVRHLKLNNIIENYTKILQKISRIDEEECSRKVQTLKEIYNVFDMIVLAYETISLEEFTNLLDYGVRSVSISTIPFMLDEVEVNDINIKSGLKKDHIYIIGAYDGLLPKLAEASLIFDDRDIQKLEAKNIKLKENNIYITNRELFNIYKAITKCNKYLEITFPSSKTSGESLRPSYILNDIKEILNINLKGNVTETNFDNLEEASKEKYLSKDISFEQMISKLNKYKELTNKEQLELFANYKYFKQNEHIKYLEYMKTDNNLSRDTLDSLYKKDIKLSISKLEKFERCPFAYFNEYNLKLIKNKEHEVTRLDLGILMHLVLERFTKYMIERNIDFRNALIDEKDVVKINRKIDEIIEDIFELNYINHEEDKKIIFLKAKIKNNMKKIIISILDSFKSSDFLPIGYEIEFEENSVYAPIRIELDNKTMYLIGKIDRVDTAKINNKIYVRVIDYKSSDKTLSLDMIKDNISLQLMTYMSAIIENNEKISKEFEVLPAAINYFNITNKVLNLKEYETEDKIKEKIKKTFKLKGIYIDNIEVLKSLDYNFENSKLSNIDVSTRNISNKNKVLTEEEFKKECNEIKKSLKQIGEAIVKGSVNIKPNKKIKDVCKYCEYKAICRKDSIC